MFMNLNDIEKIRHHPLHCELGAAANDHPFVLTEALPNPIAACECMMQIIFEVLNVHAMSTASLVLSLSASGWMTNILMDSGVHVL